MRRTPLTTVRIACGAGSTSASRVVSPPHAAAVGLLLSARRTNVDRLLYRTPAARRSAGNAGSATLTADAWSWTHTCKRLLMLTENEPSWSPVLEFANYSVNSRNRINALRTGWAPTDLVSLQPIKSRCIRARDQWTRATRHVTGSTCCRQVQLSSCAVNKPLKPPPIMGHQAMLRCVRLSVRLSVCLSVSRHCSKRRILSYVVTTEE